MLLLVCKERGQKDDMHLNDNNSVIGLNCSHNISSAFGRVNGTKRNHRSSDLRLKSAAACVRGIFHS